MRKFRLLWMKRNLYGHEKIARRKFHSQRHKELLQFCHCRTGRHYFSMMCGLWYQAQSNERRMLHNLAPKLPHLRHKRTQSSTMNRPGFSGDSIMRERMEYMEIRKRYSQEVRERAVRLLQDHQDEYESQWQALNSIASKIGCTTESLRRWVRQAEIDHGSRSGLTTSERARFKELERENRELKRANEILRKASAYFAQAELDRRSKS